MYEFHKTVGKLIKDSHYNVEIKSSLYSFFIEPIPVIQKLSYELIAKDFLLSHHYERNCRKIAELQHFIDIKVLSNNLQQRKIQKDNIDTFDDIYISFCIFDKNLIKSHFYDCKAVLLLGTDYFEYLNYKINENKLPELDIFGNAISEKNRLDILNLINQKDEITIRDIEHELGFTGTNSYYHLSLMIKANIINTRNQGRTVFYSINKHYFDIVCDILGNYSSKKGR